MSNNSNKLLDIDSAIVYSAISATFVATSLIAAQSDFLARKILSPLKLYARRRQEQVHKLDQAIAESIQRIRYHVNQGNYIDATIEEKSSVLDLVLDQGKVKELVKDICSLASPPPIIVGISKDLNRAKNQYYIYLAFPEVKSDDGLHDPKTVAPVNITAFNRRVQVPLVTFCQALANEFESTLTSTAMCFIADASSSLSSHVFTNIFQKCESALEIPLVQEPAWMTAVALLMRRREISDEQAEKILYALCRLETHRLGWQKRIGKRHKTVVFVLPGQGCTKILLPVLQRVFTCERHVFAYDGCVDSVQRGVCLWKKGGEWKDEMPLGAMPRNVSAVLPLVPMMKQLPQLPELLAKLPNHMAGVLEAWMSSVDGMISLKENEKKNMYTPFVCRLEFLLKGDSHGLEERGKLALSNVLQYITGSRSRALDEVTMDAAQSVLMDLRKEWQTEMAKFPELSQKTRTEIEDCVFCHKMILIGDKTLPDTVIPKVDWSLKAAKKLTSCACCFPGEEEDGSDAGDEAGVDDELDVPDAAASAGDGAAVKNKSKSDVYVDGKMKFAFDPSVFTGLK